jgi:hypothetical protein
MRYFEVDTVSFTNDFGNSFAIKDMREYTKQSRASTVTLRTGDRADEIATRQEYFGDGAEGDTYKIIDLNIVALFESNFDLSKLKTLEIPVK